MTSLSTETTVHRKIVLSLTDSCFSRACKNLFFYTVSKHLFVRWGNFLSTHSVSVKPNDLASIKGVEALYDLYPTLNAHTAYHL